jgi:hypothetical protein
VRNLILSLVVVLGLCSFAAAQVEVEDMLAPLPVTKPSHDAHGDEPHVSGTHPKLPEDARWAGATTLVIVGLFFAAAAVGVVVRLHAPDEFPETHSHDEHGGSHGHDDHGHGHDSGHGHAAGGHH